MMMNQVMMMQIVIAAMGKLKFASFGLFSEIFSKFKFLNFLT